MDYSYGLSPAVSFTRLLIEILFCSSLQENALLLRLPIQVKSEVTVQMGKKLSCVHLIHSRIFFKFCFIVKVSED